MTQQISFSEIEYDAKKKQTRRDVFLAKMETIVPFARLVALIAPHYPTSGRRGRPPLGKRRTIQVPREFGCDCRPLAPRKDDRPSRRRLPMRILLARSLNRALLRPFLADGPPYGRNFSRTRYRFAKAKSITTCAWFFANPR